MRLPVSSGTYWRSLTRHVPDLAYEVEAIEEHVLVCDLCRRAFVSAETYVAAMKEALADATGVIHMHITRDGLITLRVEMATQTWLARIEGPKLQIGAIARSPDQAVSQCRVMFAETFPEHTCAGMGCRLFEDRV